MSPKLILIKSILLVAILILTDSRSLETKDIEGQLLTEQIALLAKNQRSAMDASSSFLKRDRTDPEISATAMEIIQRWGYPVEKYDVVTEDGYILLLLRIPHGRNENETSTKPRPVVYMQHGLESSCTDWIINLPHQSAAYIFADNGFDVWLGNFRGNYYSTRHVRLTPKQPEFWQFSWDEMARYDLPALINTTMSISGAQSVYYVGHSMGTTTIFAQLSQDQHFAKYIKKVYALAPAATATYIKGLIRIVSRYEKLIDYIAEDIGIDDLFPMSKIQEKVAKYLCGSIITEIFCTNILMVLTGPESKQLNNTRLPVYIAHTPSGTSTRTVAHYGQMTEAKKFQMYDFGVKGNKEKYNQRSPPLYDVTQIHAPINLYWGGQDYLADPRDVEALIPKLPNLSDNKYFPIYNHMDFIWGLRAAEEIYKPISNDILNDFAVKN